MFLDTILKYFIKDLWVTNTINLYISGTNHDRDSKFEAY